MKVGEIVLVREALPRHPYPAIKAGRMGKVIHVDGDWARVELPSGSRFEAHIEQLTRVLRRDVIGG